MQTVTLPRRFVSVAPDRPESESNRVPADADTLLVAWGAWCRSRRFYGAPRVNVQSTLGALVKIKTTAAGDAPGIRTAPELALLHQIIAGLPERERLVIEAVYLHRAKPIKTVAARMGVSRATFYRILRAGALRAHAASQVQ